MYDTLPEVKGRIFVSNYKVQNEAPLQVNTSQNGKVSTRWTGVQRFDFTVRVEAFGHENIRALKAFFLLHIDTPFYLTFPQLQGASLSNSIVSANTAARASKVPVSGHKGVIQAGDFITFMNHTKMYQALNAVEGSGTLNIFPPLRSDVRAQETICTQQVKVLVRLTSPITEAFDDVDWNCTFEFEAKEAF